jgi:quercetin dioxygenase-like cupin family protein
LAALLAAAALLVSGCGQDEAGSVVEVETTAEGVAVAPPSGPQRVLDKQELTVLDQRVTYPKKKPARISSETIVLQPGEQTGWRQHKIPVYVHVLSGTYTIDYGEGALVEYPAGTAFIQATKTDYNGSNVGEEPLEVLHVYLGAKGLRDVIER